MNSLSVHSVTNTDAQCKCTLSHKHWWTVWVYTQSLTLMYSVSVHSVTSTDVQCKFTLYDQHCCRVYTKPQTLMYSVSVHSVTNRDVQPMYWYLCKLSHKHWRRSISDQSLQRCDSMYWHASGLFPLSYHLRVMWLNVLTCVWTVPSLLPPQGHVTQCIDLRLADCSLSLTTSRSCDSMYWHASGLFPLSYHLKVMWLNVLTCVWTIPSLLPPQGHVTQCTDMRLDCSLSLTTSGSCDSMYW